MARHETPKKLFLQCLVEANVCAKSQLKRGMLV